MSSARIEGAREVVRLLDQMRSRTDDLTPAWRAVGDHIAGEVDQQFATQGSHFGTPWDPRRPNYGHDMKPDAGWNPLLVQTGTLRDSFTSRPMGVERYSPQSATFGSDDYRAGFHHHGTSDIPARPILRATEQMAEDASAILARYITEGRVT